MKYAFLDQLIADQTAKRPVALVTRLADGAQALLRSGALTGEIELTTEQLAKANALLQADRSGVLESSQGAVFVRAYAPPPRMLVVGAVHITQALAPMATLAGFEVTVIDPRRAFATPERFPGVSMTTEWPDEALARLGIDMQTAVVTLTHDPKLDDPALIAGLRSPAFYIGALGSSRTHAKRVARLSERGLGEMIGRIHAPVGLDIGGRLPGEIAVSVLAQIIRVKHRGESS